MTLQEITLMSTAHNARTLGGIVVERPSECLEAISAGYSVQAIKFTLRKPEYMLSDLSNPPRPISLLSSEEIQMFHSVIQSVLAKESPDIQSKIITGSGLNTEIAIYGDDRESVSRDGRRIQEQALKLFGPENRHQMHTPFLSRGVEKNRGYKIYTPTRSSSTKDFAKN